MARARNRPRATLAALLLVAVGVVLALAARAAAAPCPRTSLEADSTLSANRGLPFADSAGAAPAGIEPIDDPEGSLAPVDPLEDPDGDEAVESTAALHREHGEGGDSGFANAGELGGLELRHRRPSRWGRLDLAIAWRHSIDDAAMGPSRRDELWLLATWSR